jgi:hypothetical protein
VNRNFHTEIAKVAKIDLDWVTFRSRGHFVPLRSSPWIVSRDRNFHTEIAKVAKMDLTG